MYTRKRLIKTSNRGQKLANTSIKCKKQIIYVKRVKTLFIRQ